MLFSRILRSADPAMKAIHIIARHIRRSTTAATPDTTAFVVSLMTRSVRACLLKGSAIDYFLSVRAGVGGGEADSNRTEGRSMRYRSPVRHPMAQRNSIALSPRIGAPCDLSK